MKGKEIILPPRPTFSSKYIIIEKGNDYKQTRVKRQIGGDWGDDDN